MSATRNYREAQCGRTLNFSTLPQPSSSQNNDTENDDESSRYASEHTFVVCADTQLGMVDENKSWERELSIAGRAVQHINNLQPRPKFCVCCGDLVDMEWSFYANKPQPEFTREECNTIQDKQNRDFQSVFDRLHPDIAMVCICGNHDVGNRPTTESVERFTNAFGDDYLAFWVNGTYNIALNSSLFSNPSAAPDLYDKQVKWLTERLEYATEKDAAHIFVYGHHPWFLYEQDEQDEEMKGYIPYPKEWGITEGGFPDSYFNIPWEQRKVALDLFQKHNVSAAFAGHFHQNMVSKASFGMDMIITGPLSYIFESNGKPPDFDEPNEFGVRVVTVQVPEQSSGQRGTISHEFQVFKSNDDEQEPREKS